MPWLEKHAAVLHERFPNAGLWVLPYATHVTATNTWRAESFALEVTRFLQRQKPGLDSPGKGL